MPFRCPDCSLPASLEITHSIDLPPDSRSDEITLQIVECSGCGFRAVAVYEESRRGVMEVESWDHTGYRLSEAVLEDLASTIIGCPDPGNRRCTCPSHLKLGKADTQGRWQGLAGAAVRYSFPMELA